MPDDDGDQRGWRQQIEDLLRHAGDLPAPPGSAKRRDAEPSDDELRAQYSIAMAVDHLEAVARVFTLQAAKRLIDPALFTAGEKVTDNWHALFALQSAHFLRELVANYLAMQRSMLMLEQDERRYFETMAERLGQANEQTLQAIHDVVSEPKLPPERSLDLDKEIQFCERLLEQIDLLVDGIRRRKPRAAAAFDALEPPIGLF